MDNIAQLGPNHILDQNPNFEIGNTTTHVQVLNYLNAINIDPLHAHEEETINAYVRTKIERAFLLLSQSVHFRGKHSGMVVSVLENYIFDQIELDPRALGISLETSQSNEYSNDRELGRLTKRINYLSKNVLGKFFHHLKKESKGISPALFLTGIGLLLNGGITVSRSNLIEDEEAANAQLSVGWSQVSIGAALTISPFFKAFTNTWLGKT